MDGEYFYADLGDKELTPVTSIEKPAFVDNISLLVNYKGCIFAIENARKILDKSKNIYGELFRKANKEFYVDENNKITRLSSILKKQFDKIKEEKPKATQKEYLESIVDTVSESSEISTDGVKSWLNGQTIAPTDYNHLKLLSEVIDSDESKSTLQRWANDSEIATSSTTINPHDNFYWLRKFAWIGNGVLTKMSEMKSKSSDLNKFKRDIEKKIESLEEELENTPSQAKKIKINMSIHQQRMKKSIIDYIIPEISNDYGIVVNANSNSGFSIRDNVIKTIPKELEGRIKTDQQLIDDERVFSRTLISIMESTIGEEYREIVENDDKTEFNYLFRSVEEKLLDKDFKLLTKGINQKRLNYLNRCVKNIIHDVRTGKIDKPYGFEPGTIYRIFEKHAVIEAACLAHPRVNNFVSYSKKAYEKKMQGKNSKRNTKRISKTKDKKIMKKAADIRCMPKTTISDVSPVQFINLEDFKRYDVIGDRLTNLLIQRTNINKDVSQKAYDVILSNDDIKKTIKGYGFGDEVLNWIGDYHINKGVENYFFSMYGNRNPSYLEVVNGIKAYQQGKTGYTLTRSA